MKKLYTIILFCFISLCDLGQTLDSTEYYWTESHANRLNNEACALLDNYESEGNLPALNQADSLFNETKKIWERLPEHTKNSNDIIFFSSWIDLIVSVLSKLIKYLVVSSF